MIRTGDRVRVSGTAGSVVAVVEDVRPVADLPDDLPGVPHRFSQQAKDALAECITHVAFLAYSYNKDMGVMFLALRHESGTWWDLQQNRLMIEPLAAVQEALFETAPRPN